MIRSSALSSAFCMADVVCKMHFHGGNGCKRFFQNIISIVRNVSKFSFLRLTLYTLDLYRQLYIEMFLRHSFTRKFRETNSNFGARGKESGACSAANFIHHRQTGSFCLEQPRV